MYERPINVVMASFLAIVGGLVAIAFLAVALIDIDPESSTYTQAALAMLLAVLFFGFAGQLFPNGKGSYVGLITLGLITIIAISVTIITDIDHNMKFGIALFIIAALMVLLVLPGRTEKWVIRDRSD